MLISVITFCVYVKFSHLLCVLTDVYACVCLFNLYSIQKSRACAIIQELSSEFYNNNGCITQHSLTLNIMDHPDSTSSAKIYGDVINFKYWNIYFYHQRLHINFPNIISRLVIIYASIIIVYLISNISWFSRRETDL